MDAKIETRPTFTLLGLAKRGDADSGPTWIPPMWDELFGQYGEQLKESTKSGPAYGATDRYDSETHTFEYLAGLEAESTKEAPEGLTAWTIPEQTYVAVRCTIKTIGEAYAFFNQEWLPEAGYQRAAGPEFEYYGKEFHGGDDEPIYMYFPIERRAS
jgi:predicted transcriptional regulator YdeE